METHLGFLKTYQRIKTNILGEGMKKYIQNFLIECKVCQKNKVEIGMPPWLFQLLHVVNERWEKISMDFIAGWGIQSTYTASQVTKVFMKEIQRLHGFPKVIINGRDPKFNGKFWQKTMEYNRL